LHWKLLSESQPHARRIDGITGILAAYRHCAFLSRTSHFFVVDADNELLNMDFSIKIPSYDEEYVYIWNAKNPVNGLAYGFGSIKLFPKKQLLLKTEMPLDMTTSFAFKIMPEIGSITHFNTSQFDTWRSAFRECVKLVKYDTEKSHSWLKVWTTVAYGPFADWCLKGANSGMDYGLLHQNSPEMLSKINDWAWLKEQFEMENSQ
jgi:hypothetical protein